jgi:hypothetical protein
LYNPEGNYIAIHNKIVFVPASFDLSQWVKIYNDHLNNPLEAKGDQNPIYDQTFAQAMAVLGFAREVQPIGRHQHPRHPADINTCLF